MELKLTNVARASLEELKLDYEDYLRQRGLPQWPREDARRQGLIDRRPATVAEVAAWAKAVHGGGGQSGRSGQGGPGGPSVGGSSSGSSTESTESIESTLSTPSTPPTYPEITANGALTLLAVATALLDRQIAAQANAFENEGGFTERLYRIRRNKRSGA